MSETADVVIVGGGGIGSSIAYFLTLARPDLKVVVCEQDPTYARASTTLAAGGIRQMFSTPENVLMSQFGFAFVQQASEALAIGGDRPELGLKIESYMRLCAEDSRATVLAQVEMQRRLGAKPDVLERAELAARFPWLSIDGVGFAVLGGGGEGVFDPYAMLQALRRKAISQGAQFRNARVTGFQKAAGRITAVELDGGEQIACATVVNASGPRARPVAAMAGLDLPVRPLKAHTFAFKSQTPIADCPVVLDHVGGFNFKPEGDLFLAAWPRETEADGPDDFDVDHELFEAAVWPALAERVPRFETIKLMRAWIGHIEWNAFDGNPVLGPHPACANFIFANGFSGHGVQHVPAAGRAIAELLAHGEYRTLDLSRLGYQRLLDNAPLQEAV
jgi:glycine/D-amino acid oxidase-like deaminating enzyme